MLKASSLPHYLFQELRDLREIRFNYKDKTPVDFCTRAIASNLQRIFPVRQILTAPVLLWKWEEMKVRKILELVDIRKCRVIVTAKNLNHLVSASSWSKEKWYGTLYRIESLDPDLISKCLERIFEGDFTIPRPNEFIPQNLSVERFDLPSNQVSWFFLHCKFSDLLSIDKSVS
jgi:insulysin